MSRLSKGLKFYLVAVALYWVAIIAVYMYINQVVFHGGAVVSLPVNDLWFSALYVLVCSVPMLFKRVALSTCLLTGAAIWRIYIMVLYSKTVFSVLPIADTPYLAIVLLSLLVGVLLEAVLRHWGKPRQIRGRAVGKIVGIAAGVIIAIPVCAAAIWFCVVLFIGPIINDVAAGRAQRRLLAVAIPSAIEVVDSNAQCLNTGNGNHIEVVVAAVVYSELPRDEVATYYGGYYCRAISGDEPHWASRTITLAPYINAGGYYLVYGIEEAATQADIRGH